MKSPEHLLELARSILEMDRRRPRQVSLRRAVSTAYYAVFHLLGLEYTLMFSDDPAVRAGIFRAVNHADVQKAARDFSNPKLPLPGVLVSKGVVVTPELLNVAKSFIDLKDARTSADYDLSTTYTRAQVAAFVELAEQVFEDWAVAKKAPAARLFLACFHLKNAWSPDR